MKYRFMERYGSGFAVRKMGQVLGVNRSGYYAYRERLESPRVRENEKLQSLIRLIWSKSRELYGSPRITAELRSQGLRCGKNRVARLMREVGIRSQTRKAFKVTTKSGGLTEADDLMQRRFQAGSARPRLGFRHHLYSDEGGMALSGSGDGSLQSSDRRLGAGAESEPGTRLVGSEPSSPSPSPGEGPRVPCGPRRAISGAAYETSAVLARHPPQPWPPG